MLEMVLTLIVPVAPSDAPVPSHLAVSYLAAPGCGICVPESRPGPR
jgi:hypothetical protein